MVDIEEIPTPSEDNKTEVMDDLPPKNNKHKHKSLSPDDSSFCSIEFPSKAKRIEIELLDSSSSSSDDDSDSDSDSDSDDSNSSSDSENDYDSHSSCHDSKEKDSSSDKSSHCFSSSCSSSLSCSKMKSPTRESPSPLPPPLLLQPNCPVEEDEEKGSPPSSSAKNVPSVTKKSPILQDDFNLDLDLPTETKSHSSFSKTTSPSSSSSSSSSLTFSKQSSSSSSTMTNRNTTFLKQESKPPTEENSCKDTITTTTTPNNNKNNNNQPKVIINPYRRPNKARLMKTPPLSFSSSSPSSTTSSSPTSATANTTTTKVSPTTAAKSTSAPGTVVEPSPIATPATATAATKPKFNFHYSPPPYQPKPEPHLLTFTHQNRPLSSRKLIPVSHVFAPPLNQFFLHKFHSFNPVQSELAPILKESNENLVVSAPTGAGKTCVFEIAMGRLFSLALDKNNDKNNNNSNLDGCHIPREHKIVYMAPSKALCEERYQDWSTRLQALQLGITCSIVTGDSYAENTFQNVASSHLILTTPEKWDSITRKWTDHLYLLGSVKLILIDEVHLLGDETRGACLETVVCRMKTVQRASLKANQQQNNDNHQHNHHDPYSPSRITKDSNISMRIVAVSATLPNINDISSFLDGPKAYAFDASYRPVPLTTHVVGIGYIGKNQYLFDKGLNKHITTILRQYSDHKSTIIFCHTKKETENLAAEIATTYHQRNVQSSQLAQVAKMSSVQSLSKCLCKGVAYHHAAVSPEDRKLVEQNFANGLIRTLCATSTLAMGVNLPAYLVVIKGTVAWRGSGLGHQEIDSGSLLQMMGRAGRPGFDTSGRAVIMTDKKSVSKYEKLSHGLEVVESRLLDKLVEILNTEISQRVITDVSQAIDWLKSTFFFARVRKNPRYYGMQGKSEQEMDSYLMSHIMKCLAELNEHKIISMNEDGFGIAPLPASHTMSHQMVDFEAMKKLMSLPHDVGTKQLLEVIASCEVLHRPVRRSEKKLLNEVHAKVKFPIDTPTSKVRIQSPSQKAFVMLQASIGQKYLDDYSLRQEMSLMVDDATRILAALEDYSVQDSKNGKTALESLLLRRSLTTSLWSAKDGVLNQLRGVGAKATQKLSENGIASFADVLSHTSHDIEHACGRKPPFGQELRSAVSKILQNTLALSAYIEQKETGDPKTIVVKLGKPEIESIVNPSTSQQNELNGQRIVTYTLTVHTDRPGGSLMFRTGISTAGEQRIPCPTTFGRIYIRLVSNLIGLDAELTLDGNAPIQKPSRLLSADGSILTPPKSSIKSHFISNKEKRANMTVGQVNLVDGIKDLRVPKKPSKQAVKQNLTTSPTSIDSGSIPNSIPQTKSQLSKQSPAAVTPSPTPSNYQRAHEKHINPYTKKQQKKNVGNSYGSNRNVVRSSENTPSQRNLLFPAKSNSSRKHKHSWQREKLEQSAMQKRAFNSSKENPFSAYKFDPNQIESNLDALSKETSIKRYPEKNVMSGNRFITSGNQRRSRFPPTYHAMRTPGGTMNGTPHSAFGGKRKRSVVSSVRLGNQDLLRMKASEQAAYSGFRTTPNTHSPINLYKKGFNEYNHNLNRAEANNHYVSNLPSEKLSPFQQWKQRRMMQQDTMNRTSAHNNPVSEYSQESWNHRPLYNSMDPSNLQEEILYDLDSHSNSALHEQSQQFHHNFSQQYQQGREEVIHQYPQHQQGFVSQRHPHNQKFMDSDNYYNCEPTIAVNDDYQDWEFDPSMPQEISIDHRQMLSQQSRVDYNGNNEGSWHNNRGENDCDQQYGQYGGFSSLNNNQSCSIFRPSFGTESLEPSSQHQNNRASLPPRSLPSDTIVTNEYPFHSQYTDGAPYNRQCVDIGPTNSNMGPYSQENISAQPRPMFLSQNQPAAMDATANNFVLMNGNDLGDEEGLLEDAFF